MKTTPGKVLIVEDNPNWSLRLKKLFEEIGFHVVVVQTKKAALQILQQEAFDFATIDLQLDEGTLDDNTFEGWKIMQEIPNTDLNKNMPFMVITGFPGDAETDNRVKSISHYKATYFIEKSKFDKSTVINTIKIVEKGSRKFKSTNTSEIKTSSKVASEKGLLLFYSYSGDDEKYLKKLVKHLSILKRDKLIDSWHFRDITAGKRWGKEIISQLNSAHIILLLISPNFISSEYCYDEFKKALKRQKNGIVRIIPVILHPVDWKKSLIGKLQALPKDGKPITTWRTQDEAFADVVEGIRKVINELQLVQ